MCCGAGSQSPAVKISHTSMCPSAPMLPLLILSRSVSHKLSGSPDALRKDTKASPASCPSSPPRLPVTAILTPYHQIQNATVRMAKHPFIYKTKESMLCRRQGLLFRLILISRFISRNAVSEEQILHVADVAGEADPCARLSPGKSTLSCPRITVIV